MDVPLEISFRGTPKTGPMDELIREKVDKLDRMHDRLVSCRVAVEVPQTHQQTGSFFRVRAEIGVPGDRLVIKRESNQGSMHETLHRVIRDVFDTAEKQLRKHREQQRRETKQHPEQDEVGFVVRLFPEQDYGFFRTLDDREVYFHRNAVANDDFDRIEIGTGVRFVESMGEEGLQASTVQIVDKPGVRAAKIDGSAQEPPLGW